jgi:Ca2+-transporting ATPase
MAFLGTTITDGRGRLLVTATGRASEVGQIGRLIEQAGSRSTPLDRKLNRLGLVLVVVVLALCALIVLAGWLRGIALLPMLEVGISLAIAAVPEGLPAVATMTLAIGMQRMARKGALIRRLPAVEALGAVTVICTDKTGTLTRNEITVQTLDLNGRTIQIDASGRYHDTNTDSHLAHPSEDAHLAYALRIGALCNDARIEHTPGNDSILGDPTEVALIVAAEHAGLSPRNLADREPRIDEIPFDSHTRRMVTIHQPTDRPAVAYVKGSPGTVLDHSTHLMLADGVIRPLTPDDRQAIQQRNLDMAGSALRVLGLAFRTPPAPQPDNELVFVGLVGMRDPLRDGVAHAVATCRQAGIRTVMITGDQPPTAAEIARQLGLDHNPHGTPLAVVHGRDLESSDPDRLDHLAATSAVFARVSPQHKLQLVEALQRQGEIVAMTGDGVNDAPALKQADIGVAMGIMGTDVARETADIVITDDNFVTIVAAVEQGRIIYANILKFIHYLFSCNFAEILTVFVAILLGWPLPLGALQLLWLNMVTDVFPALAIALEPAAPHIMKRPPVDPREGLVTPRFLGLVAWQGALLAALTLLAFQIGLHTHGSSPEGVRRAVTLTFLTLGLAQVVQAFNVRSQDRSLFTARTFTNRWLWAAALACLLLQLATVLLPPLSRVLHTVTPTPRDALVVAACSLAPLAIHELVHRVARRHNPGPISGSLAY